jgi:plastocyanin
MHRPSIVRSFALALVAAPLFAGCGGGSASSPVASQAMTPTQIPFSDDAIPNRTPVVGIRLTGETAFTSPTYGRVQGYFKGKKSMTAQVVTLSPNVPVVFASVDSSLTHTASFLGNATASSAPWPSTFTGSEAQSQAGTAIGTAKFSTGPLSPGKKSLTYNTGAPGFYMIGCAFHYVSSGMRTVIIVK